MKNKTAAHMLMAMITFSIVTIADLLILEGYKQFEVASSTIFTGSVFMLLPNSKLWETIVTTIVAYVVYMTALAFTVRMVIVC